MQVTVRGEKVTVGVSESGMFHDKSMKFYARTLKGLEVKMNADPNSSPSTVVIRIEDTKPPHRQGRVTGKGKARWGTSWRVRWDEGKSSVVNDSRLRRPMSPEARLQLQQLESAMDTAEDAYNTAVQAHDAFESMYSIYDDLRARFGR